MRRVIAWMLVVSLFGAAPVRAQTCVGDCDGSGQVSVDELVRGVNIALGALEAAACAALDVSADGAITVDELIAGVKSAIEGCTPPGATPTATPTSPIVAPTETPTPTPTGDGTLAIAAAVARDADGVALHLGEQVAVEGVVTVDAGIFANNKLKVFAQDAGAGIMIFHESSAGAEALQTGDRVRTRGVIRQQDPTSDMNAAIGTVLVDVSDGATTVLSQGNPLPEPTATTLADLAANGTALTGVLVHVSGIHKTAGDWPTVGSRSTQVDVGDDGGTTLVLRFQRNTITPALVTTLENIGDGPFDLTAIVVQDDLDGEPLSSGFELWPRGAADVSPP